MSEMDYVERLAKAKTTEEVQSILWERDMNMNMNMNMNMVEY